MSKLLPYETIVKAHEGDPDAINTVLSHYAGYIRYFSKVHGQVNAEVEEYVFFVKYFSLKKASEFPIFSKGFSLLSAGIMHPCA